MQLDVQIQAGSIQREWESGHAKPIGHKWKGFELSSIPFHCQAQTIPILELYKFEVKVLILGYSLETKFQHNRNISTKSLIIMPFKSTHRGCECNKNKIKIIAFGFCKQSLVSKRMELI